MKLAKSTAWPLLVLCGLLLIGTGCGSSSADPPPTPTPTPNVQSISVNSGPNGDYLNGLFTNVTVCTPGTSTCQTISGVLVDTGSAGLRILSSALPSVNLPQQTSGSSPVAECAHFVSGVTWGAVKVADVKLAGELARNVPVQLIGDPGLSMIPTSCTDHGDAQQTLQDLHTNGILGVSNFIQDCGDACAPGTTNNPEFYYVCPTPATCQVSTVSLAQQLQNPVALFATDNNGVIIDLPAISSAGAASVNGTMIFGIDTRTNNARRATPLPLDVRGDLTTVFNGISYPRSFIDSGSNAYFFVDEPTLEAASNTQVTLCGAPPGDPPENNHFYCPASLLNLTAENRGTNDASAAVNFRVADLKTLNGSFFAFDDVAGPFICAPGVGTCTVRFDWGLPFFYGRRVFTGLEDRSGASAPNGYIAY